jgi:hypothetical protein
MNLCIVVILLFEKKHGNMQNENWMVEKSKEI